MAAPAPVAPVARPGLPADFDIEAYLHATLAKRIMMIDGAMGSAWRRVAAPRVRELRAC